MNGNDDNIRELRLDLNVKFDRKILKLYEEHYKLRDILSQRSERKKEVADVRDENFDKSRSSIKREASEVIESMLYICSKCMLIYKMVILF